MKIKYAVSSTAADYLVSHYANRGECQGLSAPGGTGGGIILLDFTAFRMFYAEAILICRQLGCPSDTGRVSPVRMIGAPSLAAEGGGFLINPSREKDRPP